MPANQRPWLAIWGMPILMGAITIIGLLLAITGTVLWLHALSWVALTVPLFVMVKYGTRFFR